MAPNVVKEADCFTKIKFTANDRCEFGGRHYGFSSEYEHGVVMRTVDEASPDHVKAFEWEEITRYVDAGVMSIEYDYFSDRNAIRRKLKKHIFELPPRAIFRARMVSQFLAAELDVYDTGEKVTRSDTSIAKFLAQFTSENATEIANMGLTPDELKKLIVSPRQFRRLIKRFEDDGHDPRALVDRYQGRKAPVLTYSREELAYHRHFADSYLSVDRPTIKSCWEAMNADHLMRLRQGQLPLKLPSLRTFQRMINEYSDFRTEFSRSANKHRISRKFLLAGKGLVVSRPLQVVEMDEHELDLMHFLTQNRIWDYLHPEVQKKIEDNKRAWISVALDAYSRSIVGMQILYAEPDSEASIRTLAMVARNKDDLSELAGTDIPWPQAGTPEAVHTDAGSAYIEARFQGCVFAFTGRDAIPPSKHPHLRARVERFFGTLNRRYVHMFSGQTFSNILLRDEYDSEANRSLPHEQLTALLVRLIVQCYHNTPHRGLFGLTPLEAWYWGTQNANGAVKGIPSREVYHQIFGMMDRRAIGNYGIQVLNLFYRSQRLQEIRDISYHISLTIRLNPHDISRILVKDPFRDEWFTAHCNLDGMEDVSFTAWLENIRYIKRRFGHVALKSRERLLEGLAVVRNIQQQSRLAAEVNSPYTSTSVIRAFEAKELANFEYSKPRKVDRGDSALVAPPVVPAGDNDDPFNPTGTYAPIPGVPSLDPPNEVRTESLKAMQLAQTEASPPVSLEAQPPRDEGGPLKVKRSPLRVESTRKDK